MVAAMILSYHGPYLWNMKVFMWRLSLNARAYSIKHTEQIRAFCLNDPVTEAALFNIEYGQNDFLVKQSEQIKMNLFKSSKFMEGD